VGREQHAIDRLHFVHDALALRYRPSAYLSALLMRYRFAI
jgi:hypothetical protein